MNKAATAPDKFIRGYAGIFTPSIKGVLGVIENILNIYRSFALFAVSKLPALNKISSSNSKKNKEKHHVKLPRSNPEANPARDRQHFH
jgi:hypothetical protein